MSHVYVSFSVLVLVCIILREQNCSYYEFFGTHHIHIVSALSVTVNCYKMKQACPVLVLSDYVVN